MDPGLAFILNDELRRSLDSAVSGSETRRATQSIVIERRNFSTDLEFAVQDDTRSFPFYGEGTLNSLLLVTQEKDYTVKVDLDVKSQYDAQDESMFINDDFDTLQDLSVEVGSVAAYENPNGEYVLSIGPVEFLEEIRAWVEPSSMLTVKRQRAEVEVVQEV